MALCSRTNSVCSIASPTHQFRTNPDRSVPVSGSRGSDPSSFSSIRPPTCERSACWVSQSLP